MKRHSGMGLIELLITLLLGSIIVASLIQLYLSSKRYANDVEHLLAAQFDLRWVDDLVRQSIRHAGFTPCLGIDDLEVRDSRLPTKKIAAIQLQQRPLQSLQINHMNEVFTQIIDSPSSTQLQVADSIFFKTQRPILIADCEHAEIQQLAAVTPLAQGSLLTLRKPLIFSYAAGAYVGEWLEERWFIKNHPQRGRALYYQATQSEELTPLIQSVTASIDLIQGKRVVHVILGLAEHRSQNLYVTVRGS
jgi:hypothetical protein